LAESRYRCAGQSWSNDVAREWPADKQQFGR
jgi:hypothetical protein